MSEPSDDAGYAAQVAAETHLAACREAFWAVEEEPELWDTVVSPASAPFDDCDTCVVREVLWAAWPILEADARGERP